MAPEATTGPQVNGGAGGQHADGGAGTTGTGGTGVVDAGRDAGHCPSAIPMSGTPCSFEGLSCPYGDCCPSYATCSNSQWQIAIPKCAAPDMPNHRSGQRNELRLFSLPQLFVRQVLDHAADDRREVQRQQHVDRPDLRLRECLRSGRLRRRADLSRQRRQSALRHQSVPASAARVQLQHPVRASDRLHRIVGGYDLSVRCAASWFRTSSGMGHGRNESSMTATTTCLTVAARA